MRRVMTKKVTKGGKKRHTKTRKARSYKKRYMSK